MSTGLTIISWDSPEVTKFRFLQWWDSPKFSEMSSRLVKMNCYKYPWLLFNINWAVLQI